jgi:xanthine/CO dehydrogenase XdhC/CoxF family maturation factor
MKDLQAIVRHLAGAGPGAAGVLATLVAVEGSSYRRAGARMLFAPGGGRIGSISGGCLEEDLSERAGTVARTGRAETVVYDTTSENDLVWGVGTGCHGVVRLLLEPLPGRPAWIGTLAQNFEQGRPTPLEVVWEASDPALLGTRLSGGPPAPASARVFLETVAPAPRLVVFGAGDDARPLARLASELGWRVAVGDPRPAFATPGRFPEAGELAVGPADALVSRLDPGPGDLAVVMTHHYVHDVPILRALLARPLAYLGLLGPRLRAEKILSDLAADGFAISPDMRRLLRAPVGLDLGADHPEDIALSILSEMRAALAGRDGRPLRERSGPIHG